MKEIFTKIGKFLLLPFSHHFLFLISFFILATSPYILKQVVFFDNYLYSLFIATHCIAISYFITLAICLITNQTLRFIIEAILIGISAILFSLNIYCLFELGGLIDADYLMLILGTNPHEAKEFANTMLPKGIILAVSATYCLLLILWALSQKVHYSFGKKTLYVLLAFVCLCSVESIHNKSLLLDGPIQHFSDLFNNLSQYEIPDESQLNHSSPTIVANTDEVTPPYFVLIIGESFARYHSSIYGYDKLTNPILGSLKDSSFLFRFDSIDAPAPTTSLALEFVLSTYRKENVKNKDKKWFEYLTVIDLMKACGYDCYWFSNQARTGQFNYIARAFAECCKENHFYQREGPIHNNQMIDIILVDSTSNIVKTMNPAKNHFIIYHLMGSHFDYSMRYPNEFAHFSEKDYSTYPQQQRSILACYDNSILYNDYVVEQIINLYKDREALVIYLPDHGLDMYRSSSDYHAHGKMNDPISYAYGVQIPFMIYASALYQEKHPDTMQRIKYRQDHPKAWNSDDLPYFIMDLIGVQEINGEGVQSKSILN